MTASLQEIRAAATRPLSSTQTAARDMYLGFHLGRPPGAGDQFAYWRGPMLTVDEQARGEEAAEAARAVQQFQQAIRRSFTSTNMVAEVLDREVGASVSKLTWRTTREQDRLLTSWWRRDMNRMDRVIREVIATARREGRGALRFRVAPLPPGRLDPEDVARYIRAEAVAPEQLRVAQDPDTLRRWSAYAYRTSNRDAAEVCWVDERGQTVVRVMRGQESGSLDLQTSPPLALGGRLLHLELMLPALITEPVLQNQMAYNAITTMMVRNTEAAGFPERYGIGIEPPFVMEPDPQNPGQQRKRYLKVRVGNGTINFFGPATDFVPDGQGGWREQAIGGTQQYGRHEPVSPAPLTEAARYCRENIYGEVGQAFVLMSADATSSGRSREVAMSDFDARREVVTDAARFLISEVAETFLALCWALAGQPRDIDPVEGQVRGRVLPQSEGERAADLADIQAGVQTAAEVRLKRGYDEPLPPPGAQQEVGG